jgi:Protein of unknown function (DUF3613)
MTNSEEQAMKRQTLDALTSAAAAALVAFAALGVASASSNAAAQTPALSPPSPRTSEVGDATRAWLEQQRSNQAAAPALPTLGAEAGLAYERYLDSFKTKIPATYGSAISNQRANFGGYSNGGGSSSTDSN